MAPVDHVAALLLGLGNGGVFAALALARVTTYRASGVINFATGAVALYVAYTYAGLRRGELLVPFPGLPRTLDLGQPLTLAPAVALALAVGALVGAVLYLLVFRPLRDAPQLTRAVASLGVLVVLQGVLAIRQGTSPISVAPIFASQRWTVGTATIPSDRAYLALTVAGRRRLDRHPPHQRVRSGLARTFQSLELYDDLAVEENVRVAAFAVRRRDRPAAVHRALDQVGILALRDRPAGALSQGERQLVSIARACVTEPEVLLLDEPAAGLDTTESRWLGERIRDIAWSGTGVLLVDHDVALVLDVCAHVYVLDFGNVIAEGPPDAIRADRAVADAYLGGVHDAAVLA